MLVAISDQSQIAAARRAADSFAQGQGFDAELAGRVALIATEMASNIAKHGADGELLVTSFDDAAGKGVELLACDKGPGITDVARSLEDGYSTVGTPGTGLGAIRRQADLFDIFSRPGAGTVVMARIRGEKKAPPLSAARRAIAIGVVLIPYPGEIECGDSWAFGVRGSDPCLFAVDGSGHGPQAATAADCAVKTFEKTEPADGVRLIETVHRALAPTRGAAVAVARIDAAAHLVRFVGLGNISAALVDGGSIRRMISHNGTAGHVAARIREFTYPYSRDPAIVLHSDGLSAKWDLATYPGLAACHPSVIAGVLSRDYRRRSDDAMVVVMRVAS